MLHTKKQKGLITMKKFTKCLLKLTAVCAVAGGAFSYLKKQGYIRVVSDETDDDLDNFSEHDTESEERTYVHVDTQAMKEKAKEMAQDVKEKAEEVAQDVKAKAEEWADIAQDKAEDAYEDAKKAAETAAAHVATAVEKAWYEAEDTVEKVEEFFNDEEA